MNVLGRGATQSWDAAAVLLAATSAEPWPDSKWELPDYRIVVRQWLFSFLDAVIDTYVGARFMLQRIVVPCWNTGIT